MNYFICFVEWEGFVQCDTEGNFVGTTLKTEEASQCEEASDWIEWKKKHPTLTCTILLTT